MGDYGLAGGDVDRSTFVFYTQRAFKTIVNSSKSGVWPGSSHPAGAAHMGYAGGCSFCIDSADVFVDEFGLVAGGLDARGLRDQCGHGFSCEFLVLPLLKHGDLVTAGLVALIPSNRFRGAPGRASLDRTGRSARPHTSGFGEHGFLHRHRRIGWRASVTILTYVLSLGQSQY